MPADPLTIGELARRSGVASSALRFYEERGLIASERTGAGHRRYARPVIRRVAFIVFAQRIGLDLPSGEVERDLSLEDVEGLVLGVVDVHRRHVAGRYLDHVDQAEPSVGVLAVREDAGPAAQEREFLGGGLNRHGCSFPSGGRRLGAGDGSSVYENLHRRN